MGNFRWLSKKHHIKSFLFVGLQGLYEVQSRLLKVINDRDRFGEIASSSHTENRVAACRVAAESCPTKATVPS
jgi:hypothetical protein